MPFPAYLLPCWMTRQTSPIEPAVLKPYRDADEAGPGQRFKGQILQVRDMLHQPEVTLRGCAREAVPVTEFADDVEPVGVETNLRYAGRDEEIEGDYDTILAEHLKKEF
jgi:hypothetical protein